jgi:dipeptidase D
MNDIRNLEPKKIWNFFHELTQIPRPSKKEQKIVEYMLEFGKKNNLETEVDEVGNVVIRKPATKGMENRKGVIFQTHLDMVPQKNTDKIHDFEKDPIEAIIDGDWVKANGTTLGSDNGIGVAAAMAVLVSTTLEHGPVEALFTIDEETGMTGAFNLRKDFLKGDILLNLDSEDENEICVGCAGGMDVTAKKSYEEEKTSSGTVAYKITASGMKGGHSGVDIAMGRANSNKIMFRFLFQAESGYKIRVAEVTGGNLRNAIPRESFCVVVLPEKSAKDFENFVLEYEKIVKNEYSDTEPDLIFKCEKTDLPSKVMGEADQYKIIRAVYACPNGVQRMSQSISDLVETSNNMAIVKCSAGNFECHNLTRSSVDTSKKATAWEIAAVFHLTGAEIIMTGGYPGWKPNMQSPILKVLRDVYKNMFGQNPDVKAIHAGLECAIIGGVFPNLDMISFGPTIKFPHSPDEKVNIASVNKFWNFIVETLKNIPVKE